MDDVNSCMRGTNEFDENLATTKFNDSTDFNKKDIVVLLLTSQYKDVHFSQLNIK